MACRGPVAEATHNVHRVAALWIMVVVTHGAMQAHQVKSPLGPGSGLSPELHALACVGAHAAVALSRTHTLWCAVC
jgi:hypothetical protein